MGNAYVIGLTGGIASGKNSVAEMLLVRGAAIIDADQVSRDLVAPGAPLLARLVEAWGSDILAPDGSLNRPALAARVFGNNEAVKQLNALTHPAILAEMQRRVATLPEPVVVFMAPLLFEAGGEGMVDEVWVVRADERVRVERVLTRDHLDEAQARARIAAQISADESARRADVVIDNNGDLEATEGQVEQAWRDTKARRSERR